MSTADRLPGVVAEQVQLPQPVHALAAEADGEHDARAGRRSTGRRRTCARVRRSDSAIVGRSSGCRCGRVLGHPQREPDGDGGEGGAAGQQRQGEADLAEGGAGADAGERTEQLGGLAGGVQRPGRVLADLVGDPGDVGPGHERPSEPGQHLGEQHDAELRCGRQRQREPDEHEPDEDRELPAVAVGERAGGDVGERVGHLEGRAEQGQHQRAGVEPVDDPQREGRDRHVEAEAEPGPVHEPRRARGDRASRDQHRASLASRICRRAIVSDRCARTGAGPRAGRQAGMRWT